MNTNRTEHPEWTDRISDYVAGELPHDVRDAMEAHLAECGGCRRALEEVRTVIERAEALGPIEPPRDLWQGIAATIQAPLTPPHAQTKVIDFPGQVRAEPAEVDDRPRFSFSAPQLAAASIALVVASSLATWAIGPGLGVAPQGAPDAGAAPTGPAVTVAAEIAPPPPALADELQGLERTLAEARSVLDPNTVRILERNLAVIEQAIVDSRLALEQDPENEFLARHLDRVYERKLDFLREAVRVAQWSD